MGIVRLTKKVRNEPEKLPFADLALIPDSLGGITSGWFEKQKELASKQYQESTEYTEAIKRNEEHVVQIIAKRKREEEMNQFLESLKKEK